MEKNINEAYIKVLSVFGPPSRRMILLEKIPSPSLVIKRGKQVQKFWLNKYGELHSKNGNPAEIKRTGTAVWYRNGLIHRDGDMPAEIVYKSGTMLWCRNGIVCREGLKPAMITVSNVYWHECGFQIAQFSVENVALKISNTDKFDKMMRGIEELKVRVKNDNPYTI